jgi:uncharacterized protein YndB with AHSA1/START domain
VSSTGRTIELEVTILATPAEIWKALSTAEGLARWFPPIAEGAGAPNSDLFLSWGEGIDWRTHTTAWEENRHLQWTDPPKNDSANPSDAIQMVVDWYIETITGGRCVVRLVHSGFSANADWDDQYGANKEGWTYFLFNLRHYLERHADTPRVLIRKRSPATIPRAQLWTRLLGDDGLRATHSGTKGMRPGDRLAFTMDDGRSIPFVVGRVEPSILWGTIESLNDGLLMIELEPGRDEYHFGIYLSVYGLPRRDVDALRTWIATVASKSVASESSARTIS